MAFRTCRSAASLAGRALTTATAKCARHPDALESASAALPTSAQSSSLLAARPVTTLPNANFFEIYNRQRQLLPLNHLVPDVAADAWVAPNAVLVGGVKVEDKASVWYGAVLRGDLNYITVGAGSAIQDKVVIHALPPSPDKFSTEARIGRNVTVGQQSVLTSCDIDDDVIIGQKCIVLEGAVVEKGAALADGTVVAAEQLIPAGQLWAGNPAQFVCNLNPDDIAAHPKVAEAAKHIAAEHAEEFLPFPSAYIQVEKLAESLEKAIQEKEKAKAKAK